MDISNLAAQTGFGGNQRNTLEHKLTRFAKLVAEAREACAKLAENWKSVLKPGTEARLLGQQEAARDIATAIRNSTTSNVKEKQNELG